MTTRRSNPWCCALPMARWRRILNAVRFPVLAACCLMLAGARPRPSAAAETDAPTAGDHQKGRLIRLEGHEFDPLSALPSLPPGLRYGPAGGEEVGYYIVQFNDLITPAMRHGLEEAGAVPLHYLHDNAFLVKADGGIIDRAARLSPVRWVGRYEPAYKLDPRLDKEYDDVLNRQLEAAERDGSDRSWARIDSSARLAVHILTVESGRVAEVARAVRKSGGTGVQSFTQGSGLVRADIPRGALETLAREPGVLWIERELPVEATNDIARWTIQSGDSETRGTPVHDHLLTGAGQTITITDSGLDTTHPAFRNNKVTAYYTPQGAAGDNHDNGPTQHGTHVSGSAAGNDGASGQYDGDGVDSGDAAQETLEPHDGQAFGAKIQIQDICSDPWGAPFVPSPYLATHYTEAMGHNSWINSNSWASALNLSVYSSDAVATDDFVWHNKEFVVLFGAGNYGPYQESISPFATAKNIITVGASGNGPAVGGIASFSSRGPVADGRRKPDLMAPGVGLWSARGCQENSGCQPGDSNTYKQLSGTSMATPTVAGAAALIRQYYIDKWYPYGDPATGTMIMPSAALVKATLINSAVEMSGTLAYSNGEQKYPNNNQGWGRILLDNALYFPGDRRNLVIYDDPGVGAGQTKTYQFVAGSPLEPLKVTLVWTDRPRSMRTTPHLINDLDLVATAPDGTIYRGNAFVGFDPGESKAGALENEADHLNNVENVLVISNLQMGAWTITVTGHDVPHGDDQGLQPYALVITGAQNRPLGAVMLDRDEYLSNETVTVLVMDANLNQDSNAIETTSVQMTSDTETLAETVILLETSASTGVFRGIIQLQNSQTPVHGDPYLQVRNRDHITATYFDADDGSGGSGTRQAVSTIDEDPPAITAVAATDLQPRRATIIWTTDEPADSAVSYGPSLPLAATESDGLLGTAHSITLHGLVPGTTYLYQVRSADEHGTTRVDNNGGTYYSFATLPKPPGAEPLPEWATFQNSSARIGASGSMILPPLALQWSVANNTATAVNSSPVVSAGIVYTAGDGYVRARYASTGALKWERQIGDPSQRSSTPAVSGGVVYVPVDATFEDPYFGFLVKGFLFALDVTTGDTIWTYTSSTTFGIETSFKLAVDGGRVFTMDRASAIVGVNTIDGREAWRSAQLGSDPIKGVAAGDGKLFLPEVGSGGVGYVIALDQTTGAQIWTTSTFAESFDQIPLFAQGTVFIGRGISGSSLSKEMLALDAADGTVRWEIPDLNQILSTPAYDGVTLYFATSDSLGVVRFAAADSTSGDLLWSHAVSTGLSYARSSLAYADGYIYAVTDDGILRTFDATTGDIVDSRTVGEPTNSAHLAIAGQSIFVEGYYGTLYAFLAQDDPDDDNDGDPDVDDCAPNDASIHHGASERCNGHDDNCDDSVDEGLGTTTCGVGWCQRTVQNCVGGELQTCTPGAPTTEVCDNIDDDCDGLVDEDLGSTTCGTGVCQRTVPNCVDGTPQDCVPGTPGFENLVTPLTCYDVLDNDCDGVTDLDCAIDLTPGTQTLTFGTVTSGSLSNLRATTGNQTYEVMNETGTASAKQLCVVQGFLTTLPAGLLTELRVEAFRNGSANDTFQVSYVKNGSGPACTANGWNATALAISKPADDDQLQAVDLGTPASNLWVRIRDSKTSSDSQVDTLTLDRLFVFPSPIAVSDYASAADKGTVLQNTAFDFTHTSNDRYQRFEEVLSAGISRLVHTWKFTNVPAGSSHLLHIEGNRAQTTADKDDFQFYWSTVDPAANPSETADFTLITNAKIASTSDTTGGTDYGFGPATLSGTIYIRVIDTKTTTGTVLDTLNVDHLVIKTVP